jgi:hypothetical protein
LEIEKLVQQRSDEAGDEVRFRAGNMPLADKMALWHGKRDMPWTPGDDLFQGVESDGESDQGGNDFDGDMASDPELSRYIKRILNSNSYEWLIAFLERQASFAGDAAASCQTIQKIRSDILSRISQRRISRSVTPRAHKGQFRILWDPFKHRILSELKLRHDAWGLRGGIGNLMTTTLFGTQAIACSVEEYMSKVWSLDSTALLDALLKLAEDGRFLSCFGRPTHSSAKENI